MRIGDTLRITPTFSSEYALEDSKGPRPCRVVYIHPLERFYVVEFTSGLGMTWRETFYFQTRRITNGNDHSAPELPGERTRR